MRYQMVDVGGLKAEVDNAPWSPDAKERWKAIIDDHKAKWIPLEKCDWPDADMVWFYEEDGEPPRPGKQYLCYLREDASKFSDLNIMVAKCWHDLHPPPPASPAPQNVDES